MIRKNARVVSLVPSWTDTLLEAGVNVVGRTRYCIHPDHTVKSIAVVGGTKDFNASLVHDLKPDFVVVDRQENTEEMASQLERLGCRLLVSDITSVASASEALSHYSSVLQTKKLEEFAVRYSQLGPVSREKFFENCVIKGNKEILSPNYNYEYVIWKKPYMVVGKNTFIGDVLRLAGVQLQREENYPVVSEADLKMAMCLFSSEPYPFLQKYSELSALGFRGVVADGEKLSWFGIRNLKFLEASQIKNP